ncbi:hypothetical protein AB0D08_38200 [Kitasatospora sp. NPDC048540]|uniref:hypothetical protein n=1 Tax=unclassified Kitasatospora TaxID=2633591 RepID=UPI000A52C11A|nr:hypothetical protein [Kitasatospora sp. MBT63]
MTQQDPSTDQLKQSVVESFMAIIGAPDDLDTARAADDVVSALDARLITEAAEAACA